MGNLQIEHDTDPLGTGLNSALLNTARELAADTRAAVLVEAAFALPILIMLLLGVVTWSGWFMAAHSLQEVANEAARASVAGMDAAERQQIVEATVDKSVLQTGTLQPELVQISTGLSDEYFRVTLNYDLTKSRIFRNSLIPLPGDSIKRDALVRLPQL